MPNKPFFSLRNRAYELADTGRFKRWDQVAHALQAEGSGDSLFTRLDEDKLAVTMIGRCCAKARFRA
jgi:hypothetical protein